MVSEKNKGKARHFFASLALVSLLARCGVARPAENPDGLSFEKNGPTPPYLQNPIVSPGRENCPVDHHRSPVMEELVQCQNSSLFHTWRPRARFMAPRGWMNDPMGVFETGNGKFHIGYQCSIDRLLWGNVSQCSASTTDFVHFEDYGSWKNPATLTPSQLYDIRGVFDGTVVQDGWDGYPTIIYTSTSFGPLGAYSDPPEHEGVETQSVAYTTDEGRSWIKLNFGAGGNPAIPYWPEKHLTGFRDPNVIMLPELMDLYSRSAPQNQSALSVGNPQPSGDRFMLLSGGTRLDVDAASGGPRVFLYRETHKKSIRDWSYLGTLFAPSPQSEPPSDWRGAIGVNFECTAFVKLNEHGRVINQTSVTSNTELNLMTMGTEGGRNGSYQNHWPIWQALSFHYDQTDDNVKATSEFSGVLDWGRAYAFVSFPLGQHRQVMVGWTYEDDECNVLTSQRGYQGAFTLFRDIFVKVIRNIHPLAAAKLEVAPSWSTRVEADGSFSVITLGQKIIPETLAAFREKSKVTKLNNWDATTVKSEAPSNLEQEDHTLATYLKKFEVNPKRRFFAIQAQLDFSGKQEALLPEEAIGSANIRAGFRILASKHEWTDVYYDAAEEYLVIDRLKSSAIPTYGNTTERAKHRLWPIWDPKTNQTKRQSLNLTIVVDNSVLEVYANEQTVITTRVYPWYRKSVNAHFLVQSSQSAINFNRQESLQEPEVKLPSSLPGVDSQPLSVRFSNIELWDGLLNAWPKRPHDTRLPGVYSHNITSSIYGLWQDL